MHILSVMYGKIKETGKRKLFVKLCNFRIFGAQLSVFVLLCEYLLENLGKQYTVAGVLERVGRVTINTTNVLGLKYIYTLLKYGTCFLWRAHSFSSDEMTHEKCFATMVI